MPYIIKTDPFEARADRTVTVIEKPLYGGKDIAPGDEAFVWLSETAGGNGLAWQGHVSGTNHTAEDGMEISICLANQLSGVVLGKADLEPMRNIRDGLPPSEVARKLYYQAHNKVAALTHEEGDFLRGFFRTQS